MAGERILYVCFEPAFLIDRERVLLSRDYDVSTVLGEDGVLGVRNVQDFDFVLIGDEGSLPQREAAIRYLKDESSPPPIIALCRGVERVAGADRQVSTSGSKAWFDSLAESIRSYRKLA